MERSRTVQESVYVNDLRELALDNAGDLIDRVMFYDYVNDVVEKIKDDEKSSRDESLSTEEARIDMSIQRLASELPSYSEGSKLASLIIATDHAFIETWSEDEKRYFLDLTVQYDIDAQYQNLSRSEIRQHHSKSPLKPRDIEEIHQKIGALRGFQQKIREKISVS